MEEDIALANIALDLLGEARALLTYAGELEAPAGTRTSSRTCATTASSATACWSSSRAATSGSTMARQLLVLGLPGARCMRQLRGSTDADVAPRSRRRRSRRSAYHRTTRRSGWSGWATAPRSRTGGCRRALEPSPYSAELFDDDPVSPAAAEAGVGVLPSALRDAVLHAGRPRWSRGDAQPPERLALALARRRAGCPPDTWATCWPRCSSCTASHPGATW